MYCEDMAVGVISLVEVVPLYPIWALGMAEVGGGGSESVRRFVFPLFVMGLVLGLVLANSLVLENLSVVAWYSVVVNCFIWATMIFGLLGKVVVEHGLYSPPPPPLPGGPGGPV